MDNYKLLHIILTNSLLINYELHNKELLAIIDVFEEWHHLLKGAQYITTVYTNHKNLKYFMNTQILNRK